MWDSPSFGESFLILWNCGVARRRLATTRGKMPKGILLVARTIHKKRHIQYVGLSKFWGVFSYPVELWATRGKMPKGILLIARTVPIPIPTLLFI